MEVAIIVSIIAVFGSLLGAAFTYWLAKKRERESEWRKEKLSYYKAFVESLSNIVEGDDSPEGHKAFANRQTICFFLLRRA